MKSPDIIIEFANNGDVSYRLVEVKNSSETSYVRDSLYKVMGYFKDFEKSHQLCSEYPAILVVWGGIAIANDCNVFNDEIVILNRNEFLANLNKLITKGYHEN